MKGFKNPCLRILEIGAGTGGATGPILRALSQANRYLCSSYTFTDVSTGFFHNAEKRFAD
ncbi:hypothetical protein BP00DRAFT_358236 [Aspergillus indologenus CBS 114.80]|uniref:Methyltransferase type 12 domain-containing protein n=1 Tax=Aspergillus indologenus CBS 114.80 TaxID=1450541 RepID=A0A2V5HNY9_9EURO|nr:hypothetical protein BP00DRAFT_358236 [Aspergillus indologenus CBS 114.80]